MKVQIVEGVMVDVITALKIASVAAPSGTLVNIGHACTEAADRIEKLNTRLDSMAYVLRQYRSMVLNGEKETPDAEANFKASMESWQK